MKLSTAFQISIYSLTALAATMLTFAEEKLFPVALSIPLAFSALYCNERLRAVRISTLWSNLLGIAAVAYSAWEFLGSGLEGRLLSGAHLLAYLTWITLFQEKTPRQYWWLLALGLLQVALGSILTISGWYGVLLFGYLIFGIWTLSVFSLYEGQLRFAASEPFSTGKRESSVQNSIQHDPNEHWINARFVAGIISMSLAGLCLGLGFFLFVPRLWILKPHEFASSMMSGGRGLTGFTEDVRLGDMGTILESTERVLHVRLLEGDTDRPVDIEKYAERWGFSEPLFRGTVLNVYDEGHWSVEESGASRIASLRPRPSPGMIRQEIRLEPIGTEVLFAMPPVDAGTLMTSQDDILINNDNSSIVVSGRGNGPLPYAIYSPAFPKENPLAHPVRFHDPSHERRPTRRLPDTRKIRYLQLPIRGLERLIALSRELARPENLTVAPQASLSLRIALTLESYLKNSGKYSYTLNTSIQDNTIDVVEDFLFNRKAGHCEYYASALALMLRAVAIPSRMISGFKGGNRSAIGGYYEVQQRHAHTWVEAYVDNDWIVLDATPVAREASVKSLAAGPGFLRITQSFLAATWSNYVVSMSFSRQKEAFFDPLQSLMSDVLSPISGRKKGGAGLRAWTARLVDSPRELIVWSIGFALATIGLLWSLPAIAGVIRRIGRKAARHSQPARVRVEFYERFLLLVGAAGLTHGAEQTHREFADQVQQSLWSRLHLAGLSHAPGELAKLFYRVRFGNAALSNHEQAAVNGELDRLEACLRKGSPPGPAIDDRQPLDAKQLAEADGNV